MTGSVHAGIGYTYCLVMTVRSRQGVEKLGNKSLHSGLRKGGGGGGLISPQRFQQSMNIISGTEVRRGISTDSYYKGAMNVAYFLHLRGAKNLHLRVLLYYGPFKHRCQYRS